MKTEFESIISNLKECFDGKPWYGKALMEILKGLDWRRVNDEEYGSKSIAILVQHIINWRLFVLKKLEGDEAYDLIIDGDTDWTSIHVSDEKSWKELLSSLQRTQVKLLEVLASTTGHILKKKVPGKNYHFGVILTSIAQHDIYHLGQIAMLSSKHRK